MVDWRWIGYGWSVVFQRIVFYLDCCGVVWRVCSLGWIFVGGEFWFCHPLCGCCEAPGGWSSVGAVV